MVDAAPERFIPIEGCFNFRDLGGYPTQDGRTVKWRRLFRSDALQHLTDHDIEYVTNSLGVVTVVDLRNSDEVQNQASKADKIPSVQYYNIPFNEELEPSVRSNTNQDPVDRYTTTYLWVIRNAGSHIARALITLAKEGNLPAVVHCSAGKDRTGILAALVLGILGVAETDIIEDYITTNRVITQIIHRLSIVPGNQHVQSRPASYFEAQPKVMERVFSEIHSSYGDAVGYVQAHGMSQTTIRRLQKELLD